MNTLSNMWRKFRSKKYRHAFVASQLKKGIPFQIGAMRKKLGWSQVQLAEASGLTQGVISRAEDPDYGNLTLNTIARIAAGFDVAVVVRFVSFSNLVEWFENLSEETVQVPTFTEEDEAEERAAVALQSETQKVVTADLRIVPETASACISSNIPAVRQDLRIVPGTASVSVSANIPLAIRGAAGASAPSVQPKPIDIGSVWGSRRTPLAESGSIAEQCAS
jgi:transcriptional regulator with XRE-family HTH domain